MNLCAETFAPGSAAAPAAEALMANAATSPASKASRRVLGGETGMGGIRAWHLRRVSQHAHGTRPAAPVPIVGAGASGCVPCGRVVPAVLLPAFAAAAILLVIAGASKIASPYMAQASLSTAGMPAPLAGVRALALGEVAVGAAALLDPSTITATLAAVAYGVFCLFTTRPPRMA